MAPGNFWPGSSTIGRSVPLGADPSPFGFSLTVLMNDPPGYHSPLGPYSPPSLARRWPTDASPLWPLPAGTILALRGCRPNILAMRSAIRPNRMASGRSSSDFWRA